MEYERGEGIGRSSERNRGGGGRARKRERGGESGGRVRERERGEETTRETETERWTGKSEKRERKRGESKHES